MSAPVRPSAHASRRSDSAVPPGERLLRRIEAKRFFLTSPIADWMAKHGIVPRRRLHDSRTVPSS